MKAECARYIGSQYFEGVESGDYHEGVRVENLEKQSFDDGELDLVVTQDVLEHIFDPEAAFSEISRSLKVGGFHIFTVPLVNRFCPTECAAMLGPSGEVIHLVEPEYHGNPVSDEGSLVTFRWGFDIASFILSASSMNSIIYHYENLNEGIKAEYNKVIISRKLS